MTAPTFRAALRRHPIDLAQATLLIAREVAYPDLDLYAELDILDALAAGARDTVSVTAPLLTRAAALSDYLFGELGFRGNRADYYDPRNSLLNDVLERRLGIPITLAIVYIAIAQQLDIPAAGVGMPGHFIICINTPNLTMWLDPFNRGYVLTRDDCERLVRRTTDIAEQFRDEWLEPVTPEEIITRLLNNLRLIYMQQEQWEPACSVLRRMRMVRPQSPIYWRELGVVYQQLGKSHLAAHALNEYLQHSLNAPDAEHIQKNLRLLLDQITRSN